MIRRLAFTAALIATTALSPLVSLAAPAEKGGAAKPGADSGGAAAPASGDASDADTASHVIFEKKPPAASKSVFDYDYGPPASPASNLLGLTPDKAPTTTLKAFVLAAPALFGGQSGQSVAFDFAPAAYLLAPDRHNFDAYTGSYWNRLWTRARISVGALNGDNGGGDASKAVVSKAAAGLSFSLLDTNDPLTVGGPKGSSFLLHCIAALDPIIEPILTPADGASLSGDPAAEYNAVSAIHIRRKLNPNLKAADEWASVAKWIAPDGSLAPSPPVAAQAPAPVTQPPSAKAQKVAALVKQLDSVQDPQAKAALKLISDILADDETASAPAKPATALAPAVAAPDEKAFFATVEKEYARLDLADKEAAQQTQLVANLKAANIAPQLTSCSDQASRLASFGPALQFGGGVLEAGTPGRLEHLKRDGSVLWLAGRIPLSPTAFAAAVTGQPVEQTPTSAVMAFASGRFGWKESVVTGDKTTPLIRADTSDAWLGLEYIRDKFRFAGQYGWTRVHALDTIGKPFSKTGESYLFSTQMQLGDKTSPVWLGLSYGNGYGTATTLKAETALVTLTFSPVKAPDLSNPSAANGK